MVRDLKEIAREYWAYSVAQIFLESIGDKVRKNPSKLLGGNPLEFSVYFPVRDDVIEKLLIKEFFKINNMVGKISEIKRIPFFCYLVLEPEDSVIQVRVFDVSIKFSGAMRYYSDFLLNYIVASPRRVYEAIEFFIKLFKEEIRNVEDLEKKVLKNVCDALGLKEKIK